ncbi:MAG: hypothetical protein ABJB86_18825 [Bacteroidota bacterium]
MKKMIFYIIILLLAGCQHQLHFPEAPVVVAGHEKLVTKVVITDPTETDYDSLVYRYSTDKIREVHFSKQRDSVTRTYYYDASGRLAKLEDERAIYYTNNDAARRISFKYDANGQLQQTITDFTKVQGVNAYYVFNTSSSGNRQMVIFDTAYISTSYNLDWNNRIIYSTISNRNYILYDSAIFINTITAGLIKTIVNEYSYGTDSSVTLINRRIYFNQQLTEHGIVIARSDRVAPLYKSFRKKLYQNLSNWFDAGAVWQDDNYHLFPLPGGPYQSILYTGYSLSAGPASPPYTRDYEFNNSFSDNQLNKSVVDYSLAGQGSSKYTNVLRFYYKE